jgi:hypothetical protein
VCTNIGATISNIGATLLGLSCDTLRLPGVGGLSFLCQKGLGFDVEATWAVDIDDPAATAYQINHTHTHVSL